MNKSRLNQIMQILLTPYKEPRLLNEDGDYLNEVRYLYFQLKNIQKTELTKKEKLETEYNQAKKKLELFLSEHNKMKINSVDDAMQLVNLFFPERKYVNMLEEYEESYQEEAINCLYVQNLFRISESLLTFRDGQIAIRTWVNDEDLEGNRDIFEYYDALNKAEIWNILSRMIVPDVLVAAFHVKCHLTDKKYVYNQLGNVSLADKELDVILERGWAENHMHFNAGVSCLTLWEEFANPFKWSKKLCQKKQVKDLDEEDKRWALHMIVYRIVVAEFMQCKTVDSLCEFIEIEYGELSDGVTYILHEFKSGKRIDSEKVKKTFLKLCGKWKIVYRGSEDGDFLFQNIYKYDVLKSQSAEILFQIQVLDYLKNKKNRDTHNMHLFIQYLRVKNIYFSRRIQSDDVGGFKYFQKYYSQVTLLDGYTENRERKRIRNIFENQIQNTNLKKMEIRVTPPLYMRLMDYKKTSENLNEELKRSILRKVEIILDEYLKCIKEYVGEALESNGEKIDEQNNISIPQIGIVFHYIKNDHLDNRLGNACWLRQAKQMADYNKHILAYREAMIKTAKAIEELRGEIPILNEYVVGIDAASEELCTEPWIMAPVYRAIRNREITRPVVQNDYGDLKRIQNLGFTYHVGEEFRHVLSGLRYIDEVVEHFGYKPADRIGHAIALGVDIDYWVSKNEVITMPINEYLENLIWLWGNIVYGGIQLSVSVEVLEGKILEFAQKIYGDISGMTAFMIYQAYCEKFRRSHDKTFEKMEMHMDKSDVVSEHFCGNYNPKSPLGVFWTKEKIVCTYFCPIYWQRFQEPILVSVKKDEAKLFKEVQQQIIRKIERQGIYVETNPTSNSVVGEMPGILCHPILKLNSEGLQSGETNSVLVTINSDDPVVFNTNSENEIAYVYYALLHNGYDKERVLKWIDKIRQYGMDSSFIKGEKKPSKQIKEMQVLLERIRKR